MIKLVSKYILVVHGMKPQVQQILFTLLMLYVDKIKNVSSSEVCIQMGIFIKYIYIAKEIMIECIYNFIDFLCWKVH